MLRLRFHTVILLAFFLLLCVFGLPHPSPLSVCHSFCIHYFLIVYPSTRSVSSGSFSFLALGSCRIIIGNAGVLLLGPVLRLFLLIYLGPFPPHLSRPCITLWLSHLTLNRRMVSHLVSLLSTLHYSYTTSSIHTSLTGYERYRCNDSHSHSHIIFASTFLAASGVTWTRSTHIIPSYIAVIVICILMPSSGFTPTRHSC